MADYNKNEKMAMSEDFDQEKWNYEINYLIPTMEEMELRTRICNYMLGLYIDGESFRNRVLRTRAEINHIMRVDLNNLSASNYEPETYKSILK